MPLVTNRRHFLYQTFFRLIINALNQFGKIIHSFIINY
jgi:hypothetical protein